MDRYLIINPKTGYENAWEFWKCALMDVEYHGIGYFALHPDDREPEQKSDHVWQYGPYLIIDTEQALVEEAERASVSMNP